MKTSSERILTTHVGSLPRSKAVTDGVFAKENEQDYDPAELTELLTSRPETHGPPTRELTPAWSRWWLWLCVLGLLSTECIWRRVTGLA